MRKKKKKKSINYLQVSYQSIINTKLINRAFKQVMIQSVKHVMIQSQNEFITL